MICAFCGEEMDSRTKEHVIPAGIIDLFPQCDIVFHGKRIYKGESTIRDVCAECNNLHLSKLDSYGKDLIKQYFLKEYKRDEKLEFFYDYELLKRWALKIIFNSLRCEKIVEPWFQNIKKYLIGKENNTSERISLFAGIACNVSPLPESATENKQMQVVYNPFLMLNGIHSILEMEKMGVNVDESKDIFDKVTQGKYLLRIGSGLFLIMFWSKDISNNDINDYEKVIEELFPYRVLKNGSTIIERCTDEINCNILNFIHSCSAMQDAQSRYPNADEQRESLRKFFG